MIDENKFKGCFKCLAIADALGASYEGGLLERAVWWLIGKTGARKRRYTDDTQMSMDLAVSFLEKGRIDQDHLAKTFASGYKWSRGYGPGAAKLLKGIKAGKKWQELNRKKFKDGSLGNGAAMRAPIVALCHPLNDSVLKDYVTESAEITHAHPLAIEGAYIIAVATCMTLNGAAPVEILACLIDGCEDGVYQSKLEKCKAFLQRDEVVEYRVIKKEFGNGILASESCITSLYYGLKFRNLDLEKMLNEIFLSGGDTDTIGAMAGALWGAFNGDTGVGHLAEDIENMKTIEDLAVRLHGRFIQTQMEG